MPSSKPDLIFDESGICSACRNYENRIKVNWEARKEELKQILEK